MLVVVLTVVLRSSQSAQRTGQLSCPVRRGENNYSKWLAPTYRSLAFFLIHDERDSFLFQNLTMASTYSPSASQKQTPTDTRQTHHSTLCSNPSTFHLLCIFIVTIFCKFSSLSKKLLTPLIPSISYLPIGPPNKRRLFEHEIRTSQRGRYRAEKPVPRSKLLEPGKQRNGPIVSVAVSSPSYAAPIKTSDKKSRVGGWEWGRP